MAGDPDTAPLPRIASLQHATYLLPWAQGRQDEAAASSICQGPAGMSQAPLPARQCQGEGTPLRESRATVRGDRRRAGGRDGMAGAAVAGGSVQG